MIEGWSGQVGEKKEVSYNRAVCVWLGEAGGRIKTRLFIKGSFMTFMRNAALELV